MESRPSVLIVDFDLFAAVGGGQTVYRNLIRRRPDTDFHYFQGGETAGGDRPANAHPIPFRRDYDGVVSRVGGERGHLFHVFRDTMNMALSVQAALPGHSFEVVDTPDYRQNALFLRDAMTYHGIKVGTVALALHGTLSSALRGGWAWSGDQDRFFAELHLRERLQFHAAEVRYALSEAYADDLRRRADLPIAMIDPLAVLDAAEPTVSPPEDRAPDLLFAGRRERRKGPDLFVDAAWWAGSERFRKVILAGEDGTNHQGAGSDPVLKRAAELRRVSPEVVGGLSRQRLRELYRGKTIAVMPSRYDQFNLAALEALLDGCPTVVADSAGVARWIRTRLPALSWLVADLRCERDLAERIARIADDYDGVRSQIVETLEAAGLQPDLDSLHTLYNAAPSADGRTRAWLRDLFEQFVLFSQTGFPEARPAIRDPMLVAAGAPVWLGAQGLRVGRGLRRRAGTGWRRAQARFGDPRGAAVALAQRKLERDYELKERLAHEFRRVGSLPSVHARIADAPERTDDQKRRKIDLLNDLVNDRMTDRSRWYGELARLERALGHDLTAAAYDLRLMRWQGDDRRRRLPAVVSALTAAGLTRDAEAAEAMYGDWETRHERTRAYLDDQYRRQAAKPELPLAIVDDRRGGGPAKVSVIVSLYNAADKLPTFLAMLRQQSMMRSGAAEVVLVDSGSPADERGVFETLHAAEPFRALYIRSAERESIQSAWNRGIRASRGEQLCFLGVDEGIRPPTLEILSRELDTHPDVDWVMADSLVTEVDRHGVFSRDIMTYDRGGYRQDRHYLDSTFLSYVGGLYRRSLHDRFGWYDESFRAAGDTEFKNRVLPHIRTRHVPQMLGVFNNYPDGQTTRSPRAELEDLRAWYMHRTYAGMGYAFDRSAPGEVIPLFLDTFRYRKCYCWHWSTDLDLALSVGHYLEHRFGEAHWRATHARVAALRETLSGFDLWPSAAGGLLAQYVFAERVSRLRAQGRAVAEASGLALDPALNAFNDNRFEQHWWSWSDGSRGN